MTPRSCTAALLGAAAALMACAPAPPADRADSTTVLSPAPSPAPSPVPSPTASADTAAPPDWDAAHRAGVDFRAVGQEPGWLLDVDEGGSLRYHGDYGETRLSAPAPPSDVAGDGTRTWRAQAGGRTLVVVARPVPCQDGMSGAAFTHTVTVEVDGGEVRGCGQSPARGAPVVP